MNNLNVLSWNQAIKKGFQPSLYPYSRFDVPMGDCIARLDCKIWAKKIMAISCYFTELESNRRFQATVYCNFKTGLYQVNSTNINFANCPIGGIYRLMIALNVKGRIFLDYVGLIVE